MNATLSRVYDPAVRRILEELLIKADVGTNMGDFDGGPPTPHRLMVGILRDFLTLDKSQRERLLENLRTNHARISVDESLRVQPEK